ncbi:hypothetical protein SAMN06265222_11512 [Neorhodopirellula lusitana]|uniref:Uncharacterized protein n=1 Tax=Neorhodopirellula lusitana TaxID=445327 RepID=A0ABY1QM90_9BACT|nr:hypothetical protein SAMN06265222_11512 [Neorhodopirellula lusitana]
MMNGKSVSGSVANRAVEPDLGNLHKPGERFPKPHHAEPGFFPKPIHRVACVVRTHPTVRTVRT